MKHLREAGRSYNLIKKSKVENLHLLAFIKLLKVLKEYGYNNSKIKIKFWTSRGDDSDPVKDKIISILKNVSDKTGDPLFYLKTNLDMYLLSTLSDNKIVEVAEVLSNISDNIIRDVELIDNNEVLKFDIILTKEDVFSIEDEEIKEDLLKEELGWTRVELRKSGGDQGRSFNYIYQDGIPSSEGELKDFKDILKEALKNQVIDLNEYNILNSQINFYSNDSLIPDGKLNDFLDNLKITPNIANVRYDGICEEFKDILWKVFYYMTDVDSDQAKDERRKIYTVIFGLEKGRDNINGNTDFSPASLKDIGSSLLEGMFVLNTPQVDDLKKAVSYPYDAEFYSSSGFPLIDYTVKCQNVIFPISVKDASGGNKSSCCRMINNNSLNKFAKSKDKSINDWAGFVSGEDKVTPEIVGQLENECKKFRENVLNNCTIKSDSKNLRDSIFNSDFLKFYRLSELKGPTSPDIVYNEHENGLLRDYIAKRFLKITSDGDTGKKAVVNLYEEIFEFVDTSNTYENIKEVLRGEGEVPVLNLCESFACGLINSSEKILKMIKYCIVDLPSSSFGGIPVFKVKPRSGYNSLECIPQDYDIDDLSSLGEESSNRDEELYKKVLGEKSYTIELRSILKGHGGRKVGVFPKDNNISFYEIPGSSDGGGQFFGYEFKESGIKLNNSKKINFANRLQDAISLANLL